MIINDIEYAILFWVENEDEEEIVEKVFNDLQEMNEYITQTWKDPMFDNAKATFSPIEVINGEPIKHILFEFYIEPYVELSDDELEDFLSDILEAFEESKALSDESNKKTKFIPTAEAENYTLKKTQLDEFSYICPHCYREIDDCRCESYPYYLVQIDKLLVPVVRTLNTKGYITRGCCCGHFGATHINTIYISFEKEHNFGPNLPMGSIYEKSKHIVRFDYALGMEKEEFLTFQENCIVKFMEWAEKLPEWVVE